MLAEAKRPVGAKNITGSVDLVCGNIFDTDFPPKLFDMVYCLGVFGDWCGVSPELLEKVRRLLKVDGKFVFTVVDAQSPQATSWKRTLAGAAKPFLPLVLKRRVDERLRPFRIFEADLRKLLDVSSSVDYVISRRYSGSGRIDIVCVTSFTP
jgi:SAM-dependent methyltransferase